MSARKHAKKVQLALMHFAFQLGTFKSEVYTPIFSARFNNVIVIICIKHIDWELIIILGLKEIKVICYR